jgi:ubiquinone/menaquinone biosynthesis C-methylase UbiE
LGLVTHAIMSEQPTQAPSVRHGYNRWAAVYDHDANPLVNLEEPFVRAALGEVRGLKVLDLGCGTGRHSLWLAEHGAEVTALDFSDGMLAAARQKPGSAKICFVVHDLHEPLPFAPATFELVVSGLVLEHLQELDLFFCEMWRVLRPTGRAVVSAMHPAMFLADAQAQFRDPESGEKIRPGSVPHQIGDFVLAAVRAGFHLDDIVERAPDAAFAARFPRAERFVGWPMLVVMKLSVA